MSSAPTFSPEMAGGRETHAPWLSLWLCIVLVSPTSEIACQAVFGVVPDWVIWARISVLIAVAVGGGALRAFAAAYLVQLLCVAGTQIARNSRFYNGMKARGFASSELFLALILFAVIVPALVWCARDRDRFFLRAGNLSEPVRPFAVRWSLIAPLFAVVAALSA